MSLRVSGLWIVGVVASLVLSGCGNRAPAPTTAKPAQEIDLTGDKKVGGSGKGLFSLFAQRKNPSDTIAVNKYIWNATIDVLGFLPIESADPFTGLIVTGYGTPPGGRVAYRATVLVSDPSLDARSLNLSLSTRSGPVDDATRAAVEDAILTRARQLRVQDLKL